jgi:hypothetical protein
MTRLQEILRRCRAQGIAATFDALVEAGPADGPGGDPVQTAIVALVTAESWADTRAVVEARRDVLLSDAADEEFAELIAMAEGQGNAQMVDMFVLHRDLLRACRAVGIAATFEELEAQADEPAAELPFPAELPGEFIDAMRGDGAAKMVLVNRLTGLRRAAGEDAALRSFYQAMLDALLGKSLPKAGAGLPEPYAGLWQAICEALA